MLPQKQETEVAVCTGILRKRLVVLRVTRRRRLRFLAFSIPDLRDWYGMPGNSVEFLFIVGSSACVLRVIIIGDIYLRLSITT